MWPAAKDENGKSLVGYSPRSGPGQISRTVFCPWVKVFELNWATSRHLCLTEGVQSCGTMTTSSNYLTRSGNQKLKRWDNYRLIAWFDVSFRVSERRKILFDDSERWQHGSFANWRSLLTAVDGLSPPSAWEIGIGDNISLSSIFRPKLALTIRNPRFSRVQKRIRFPNLALMGWSSFTLDLFLAPQNHQIPMSPWRFLDSRMIGSFGTLEIFSTPSRLYTKGALMFLLQKNLKQIEPLQKWPDPNWTQILEHGAK